MPLPAYPPELPAPLRDGYEIGLGDGRYRSQNDAGPPNIRRRFSSTTKTVPFSTMLTRHQVGRFERFYYDDTKQGARPFVIADHATDGLPWLDDEGVPLLYEDETPILISASWIVLFDQLPVIRPRDIYWTVSFSLLVMP